MEALTTVQIPYPYPPDPEAQSTRGYITLESQDNQILPSLHIKTNFYDWTVEYFPSIQRTSEPPSEFVLLVDRTRFRNDTSILSYRLHILTEPIIYVSLIISPLDL